MTGVEGRPTPRELDASLYDLRQIAWPGELEFYWQILGAQAAAPRVLEIACGTGRVTWALADAGFEVTGLDLSPAMLETAKGKELDGIRAPRFVLGDMRAFDLGRSFDAVIVPAHSFQFLLSPTDQVAALGCFAAHLVAGGIVVVHVNHDSLADLVEMDGVARRGSILTVPGTGRRFRPEYRWQYDHGWQTASVEVAWEELDPDGGVLDRWELERMDLHVPTAAEMEHAMRRAGFEELAVQGDFAGSPLGDRSPDMIWTGRRPPGP